MHFCRRIARICTRLLSFWVMTRQARIVPFGQGNEEVRIPKFHGEDAVAQVMPVDNDLGALGSGEEPYQGKRGNTGRILYVQR